MKTLSSISKIKGARTSAWGIAAVSMLAFFLSLWWNKGLGGTTEGWFQHYANLYNQGQMPYRDFYLFTPPGHLLETVGLSKLFGLDYVVFRWAGLIQRLAMCAILYTWLVRFFHPMAAFLGAAVCLIAYSGDGPDVLFYAHHSTAFWSLLCCWCASFFDSKSRWWFGWMLGAGFVGGINFCVKQTTGLGLSLFIPVAWVIMAWRSPLQARLKVAIPCYAAAWLLPVTAMCVWIFRHQAWQPFVDQVFLRGTASKGPLIDTLLRPFSPWPVLMLYLALGFLVWRLSGHYLKKFGGWKIRENITVSPGVAVDCVALVFFAILAGYLLAGWIYVFKWGILLLKVMRALSADMIALVFPGSMALAVRFCPLWASRNADRDIFFLGTVGGAMAVFYALSWVIYDPMVLPGLGLLIAFITHHLLAMNHLAFAKKLLLRFFAPLMFVYLVLITAARLGAPFDWSGWTEPPVYAERGKSTLQGLRGMNISVRTNRQLEAMVELIQKNSGPKDALFVFPHFPLIYTLAERGPATFSQVQWFDVCPDYMVLQDMKTLEDNPPRIIVEMRLGEKFVEELESDFRGGEESGQREMIQRIQEMTKGYNLLGEFTGPPFTKPVYVWVRNSDGQIP